MRLYGGWPMAMIVGLWVWQQGYQRELDHEMWRDSYQIRVHNIKRKMRQQVGKRSCVLEKLTIDFLITGVE